MWAGIFPGQGSQQIGMGQFLFDNFKVAKNLFEEASDATFDKYPDLGNILFVSAFKEKTIE